MKIGVIYVSLGWKSISRYSISSTTALRGQCASYFYILCSIYSFHKMMVVKLYTFYYANKNILSIHRNFVFVLRSNIGNILHKIICSKKKLTRENLFDFILLSYLSGSIKIFTYLTVT